MSEKYRRKKSSSKNKKNSFNIKKHKKIENVYFRFFYIITLYFLKALKNIVKIIFINIKKLISNKKECQNPDKPDSKVFSFRCSLIITSIILISVLFIYIEKSIIYAYPILTCIVPIIILSEGANSDAYNQYKDLSLCNKVLKINTLLFLLIYIIFREKIWFINFSMILIFIIPLIIGNLNKEKNWKKYE